MSYGGGIYKWFLNSNKSGCSLIKDMPEEAKAWLYRDEDSYGVMIVLDDASAEINERFSNVRLYTADFLFEDGGLKKCLILSCGLTGESYSEKFALMCRDFIEPGENCEKRKERLENPFLWWADWKKLIGNVDSDKSPYAVLGELISYDYLLTAGENPVWEGPESGTVDLRTKHFDCEIKSTTDRTNKKISVSSIHQLGGSDKELHLYHCCFEKSDSGLCINDLIGRLSRHGADMERTERGLKKLGYPRGSSGRTIKYRLLSINDYLVDDKFPKITYDSFVGGTLPAGIASITYVVSLDNLESAAIHYR
jgi:hypothetical protein